MALINDAFPAQVIIAGLGRADSGGPAPDTWTVFSFSEAHTYAADDAALAIAVHQAKRPGDLVQAMISDAFPASVITANLIASQ